MDLDLGAILQEEADDLIQLLDLLEYQVSWESASIENNKDTIVVDVPITAFTSCKTPGITFNVKTAKVAHKGRLTIHFPSPELTPESTLPSNLNTTMSSTSGNLPGKTSANSIRAAEAKTVSTHSIRPSCTRNAPTTWSEE